MKRGPRVLLASSMALAVVVSAAAAHAQTSDEAGALSLFEDAKKLVDEGKYAEACPKLATSYKLAQRLGTLLNLADCYEKNGQTASAWARFTEAATMAERAGQPERMEFAKDHAAALSPKLSRLTIHVTSPPPGIEVKRDGMPVDAPMFGEAVAVDPGTHVVDAAAPGKKPWSGKVDVAPSGASATVDVPALEDAPVRPPASPPPASPPAVTVEDTTGKGQRTWGSAFVILGVLGLAAGGGLAGAAKANYSNAAGDTSEGTNCIGDVCNASGVNRRSESIEWATIANYAIAGGAVLLAAGITLYATAPSPKKTSAAITASPSGLAVRGSWW